MIQVLFYDDSGERLYEAHLPTLPMMGDVVTFPAGYPRKVVRKPGWNIAESADDHYVVIVVGPRILS